MSSNSHDPGTSGETSRHYIRIIVTSKDNQIVSDSLHPWSAAEAVNAITGEPLNFPEAEVPSGIVERDPTGREVLQTVEGFTLLLDGRGSLLGYDETGAPLQGPGIYMVVEVSD